MVSFLFVTRLELHFCCAQDGAVHPFLIAVPYLIRVHMSAVAVALEQFQVPKLVTIMRQSWLTLSSSVRIYFNILSICLVATAVLFFFIGDLGYLPQKDAVDALQWIVAAFPTDDDLVDDNACIDTIYFGLQRSLEVCNRDGNSTAKTTRSYRSDSCSVGNDICRTCLGSGQAAFALVLAAGILAVWSLVLVSLKSDDVDKPPTLLCAGLCGASFATSLAGVLVFMGDCYRAIKDFYSGYDTIWGAGAGLTITGTACMGAVCVMQIMLVYCDYELEHETYVPAVAIVEIEMEKAVDK